jgi:tetratricopeptide (TPR) repeat protein
MRFCRVFVLIFIFLFFPAGFFSVSAQTSPGFSEPDTSPAGPARLSAAQNYRIGRDLEARDRLEAAESYYNEAVRICNDEISKNAATRDTYAVLTWALQRQRKYAEVISWGAKGLSLYADDYRIIETMGEAYFFLKDYKRSLQFMQRYVNSLPQGERASVAYFFIGEIYRLERKFRHADIAYTTALRLNPGLILWWYRLGMVREAAGEYAPAMEAYERALRLDPNYQDAVNGLTRLRQRG